MTHSRHVVEHHEGDAVTVIAEGAVPLAPIAARLRAAGKHGELLVRDRDTGPVLVRYQIDPDPPADPPDE